ncbi:MAG: hypothetical protein QXO54_03330 [Candidatus Methanomethylicaceae archaeon]|nr:hypothetical protein [Candidatus Verstraetearchaeota archaeon]
MCTEGRRWPKLPQRARKEEYYEELARIINLCQSIRAKGEDPFLVDVPQKLQVLKKLLPQWKLLDELLMDAEALKELSLMVKLQSDWVKRRASGLFIDPFLVEVKIKLLGKEELASALLASWRPLIAAEQLTPKRLSEALDYWRVLLPLSQRMRELEAAQFQEEKTLAVSELIRLKFLSERAFNEEVRRLQEELTKESEGGPVDYWKFVIRDTYEETLLRAYALSFIISNGYANLIINPVEETIMIETVGKQTQRKGGKSVPISITYEKWMAMRNSIKMKG